LPSPRLQALWHIMTATVQHAFRQISCRLNATISALTHMSASINRAERCSTATGQVTEETQPRQCTMF